MKFFIFMGMALTGAILDWLCYFGIYFIADDALGRKAAVGLHDTGALGYTMTVPVILTIVIILASGIFASEAE